MAKTEAEGGRSPRSPIEWGQHIAALYYSGPDSLEALVAGAVTAARQLALTEAISAAKEHEAKYRAELTRLEAEGRHRDLMIEMRARIANASELEGRLRTLMGNAP